MDLVAMTLLIYYKDFSMYILRKPNLKFCGS